VLLTRAPLYSWYCYHFLVRLACVRHAASVDSEPGSNSRLKPDCFPKPTEVGWVQLHRALERRDALLVRMIKPNLIFSHDWHVQPNCQRSLRDIRLSGALLDRGPAVTPGCPRTCCARQHRVALHPPAFLREPFKHIELHPSCQAQPILPTRGRSNSLLAVCSSRANSDLPVREDSRSKRRAAQNIKERPAKCPSR
jgi:hypothetical protein